MEKQSFVLQQINNQQYFNTLRISPEMHRSLNRRVQWLFEMQSNLLSVHNSFTRKYNHCFEMQNSS